MYELVKQDENELEIFLEDHPELFSRIDKVCCNLCQSYPPRTSIAYPILLKYGEDILWTLKIKLHRVLFESLMRQKYENHLNFTIQWK